MKESIYSLIYEIADDDQLAQIQDQTDLINDAHFDSLNTIKLLIAIEEQFGIEIDFDDFDFELLGNAGDFAAYIASQVA